MRTPSLTRPATCDRQVVRSTAVLLAVVLALATRPTPAHAQRSAFDSLLRVGVRVNFRTWATDAAARRMSPRVIGTVIARDGDELRVRDARTGTVVTVGERQLAFLDVSDGRHHHPVAVALIGFGGGAVVGAVVALACSLQRCSGGAPSVYNSVPAGAAVGTIAGATVGYFISTERWIHAIPSGQIALRINPGPGRMTIAVRHSF